MGLRVRTILLGLIVIGLAVWIFGIDLPGERRRLVEQEEAARLFPIEAAAVDTIRVEHPEHPWTVVRRDDVWWITRPIEARAEKRTISSVLERLLGARSERTMTPDLETTSWENYGLSAGHPGRVDVILAGDGGERAALAVGNMIVAGQYCYVRRDDSSALELADELVYDLANSTHQGLRRVDLFDIRDDDVVRITMDGPGGRWTAVRDTTSGLWYPDAIGKTPRYRRWILDDIVLAVAEQRVQTFLRDGLRASDWAAYGLDDPWAEVRLTTRDGKTQTLWLGNERESNQFFARRSGLDTVFVVRPQFVGALDAGTIGLEDSNPIPANLRRALAFRVEDDEGRWGELRPAGMDWVLVTGGGEVASTTYRQTAADNVATGLETMQPERSLYMPSGGDPGSLLSERLAQVEIRFERETIDLHFGWREGEANAWFYVEGDNTLYEVERGMILRLHSFVDALYTEPSD